MKRLSGKRCAYAVIMKALMGTATALTAALVLFLIVYVLRKGLPNLSWQLLSTAPSYLAGTIGILPDILNTLYMFFCEFFGMQTSLIAGALTLVIMNLPTVMRTTQESLKTVPQSYREGAFGLGAGKWRVIRTVVLPGCVDGVITGAILSVGRILGESAALLFTAGFGHVMNDFFTAITKPGATLTISLYFYAKEDGEFGIAFAIAAILMAMTLLLNIAAGLVSRHFGREKNNE